MKIIIKIDKRNFPKSKVRSVFRIQIRIQALRGIRVRVRNPDTIRSHRLSILDLLSDQGNMGNDAILFP
jgi:hypothetical protein